MTQEIATKNTQSLELSNHSNMAELAKDLAKFIKDQKLSTNIQGKEYVNIEGWMYAGSRLGILAVVNEVKDISTETEIKYQSRVFLKTMATDQVVGGGFAMCSNKEQGKKFHQEFAIASMSQTRATGKAYRLLLGWIMKLAGYESCNAEEMDFQQAEVVEEKKPKTTKQEPTTELATQEQKEQIIKLLNHGLINREEKNKMLLNINKLDKERAQIAINKLEATIEERESAIAHQIAEEQAA